MTLTMIRPTHTATPDVPAAIPPGPPLPDFAQIEPIGRCNLACRMCTVNDRGDVVTEMPLAQFTAILDQLPALKRLHLQGLGEPMLHPQFFDMVELAAQRGIEVSTNSNLTLLTEARAWRCVTSGLASLSVSLDGATAPVYEAVRRGERRHVAVGVRVAAGNPVSVKLQPADSSLAQLGKAAATADNVQAYQQQIQQAQQLYCQAAEVVSELRQSAALELSDKIARSMAELSMANGKFYIAVESAGIDKANASGWDQVDFLVSTNPGQPLQPLHKVASGGELSRISLAIQVILAGKVTTPTLIFDEVDVGISGPVAAGVGRLLRQLGESTQVICVTHLPQVASQGHHQLFVEKYTDGIATETRIRELADEERVQEIARLLAGENVSANAIANARELLCAP